MKSVLLIICLLSLAHYSIATACSAIPQYTTSMEPACAGNDTETLWPNYENFEQYYKCEGVGKPVLTNCSVDTYFCFYFQTCTPCASFLAAPKCENLRTETGPVCVAIQNSTTAAPALSTSQAPNTVSPNIPKYSTTFNPACEANDLETLWPNYENFSEYYKCQEVGNAVIVNCADDTYFCYYYQICITIDKFIPAPECESLRTQSTPDCVPIGSTSLATTEQPTGKPTNATTETPTKAPKIAPTNAPTTASTNSPTNAPTAAPTNAPTAAPTNAPTAAPTDAPTTGSTVPAPPTPPAEPIPTPPVIG